MEAITKNKNPQDTDDMEDDSRDITPAQPPTPPRVADHAGPVGPNHGGEGYFHIYKKGQGYWTRMGTLAAVALLGLLTGTFIATQLDQFSAEKSFQDSLLKIHLQQPRLSALAIGVFGVAYAILMFHIVNKPHNVDFLIATDSEMKKVNWTSRKELFGSTRVIILFTAFIATVLFLYDLFFHTFFYMIGVLKAPPPFFPGKH